MFVLSIITALDSENGDFLRSLIDEHGDKVYAIAYSYVKNHHDAKDIVQDVFINVYKTLNVFSRLEREKRAALIVKYTRNKSIDYLRRDKKKHLHIPLTYLDEEENETFFEIADNSNNPEKLYLEKESEEKIISLISALSPTQRDVLEMKYKYFMSEKEIAHALLISESAVSSRISRAKSTLKKLMKGEENE